MLEWFWHGFCPCHQRYCVAGKGKHSQSRWHCAEVLENEPLFKIQIVKWLLQCWTPV